MLGDRERDAIHHLWARKLQQDADGLPRAERHRNLDPASAEFVCALASGIGAQRLLDLGGSSGISTIALAAAARRTGGRTISIELEPMRQVEARQTVASLGLTDSVEFALGDAADILPHQGPFGFVLIDCEKDDYLRFFDMLDLGPGAVVVADNVISHDLKDYVAYVRSRDDLESMTLPIGKGLEVTRKWR